MGCDGGSIPRRDEMVRVKKAPEKPDAASQLAALWFLCSLSKQELQQPIVSCQLGRLYNKSSILEHLLKTTDFGESIPHIKSLKDVKTLNMMKNPTSGVQSSIQSMYADKVEAAPFVCPITLKEMNGHSKFSYLRSCGCVMSDGSFSNVKTLNCLVCNEAFSGNDDVIVINPASDVDLRKAQDRLASYTESKKRKSSEKKKKSKREVSSDTSDRDSGAVPNLEMAIIEKVPKKRKVEEKVASINMVLPDLSSLDRATSNSKVVQSMYHNEDTPANANANWLTKGTFNRYSAC